MNRAELEKAAAAAMELQRRYSEQKIKWYKPCSDKHVAFHKSMAQTRIVLGGNRSSKTFTSLKECIFRSCFKKHPFTGEEMKPGVKGRIFAPDYGIIEKKFIPDLFEWVPKQCLEFGKLTTHREAFDKSYDSRYHILHLVNGGSIDLMSYDQDTSKGESVELNWAFADEEMPEDWYNATVARLITRNGKFWMAVTPLYGMTWGMKFLEGLNPNVEVFKWHIFDNPFLSKESLDAFVSSVSEHEKEARLFGEFMAFRGIVYKELSQQVHLITKPEKEPFYHWPVVFCMDPHPRKATVMTWAYVTPQNDLVFFDELEMKGTAREIASAIRVKEVEHRAPTTFRLIDPAARGQGSNLAYQTDTLREFEKEGLGFTLADNSEAGYNVVHEYLAYDRAKEISSLNRPRLYVTRNCEKTWYGLTHLLWDDWSNRPDLKDEKERVKDWKKDFPDCVRYTCASRPQFITNYTPQAIGNIARRTRRI